MESNTTAATLHYWFSWMKRHLWCSETSLWGRELRRCPLDVGGTIIWTWSLRLSKKKKRRKPSEHEHSSLYLMIHPDLNKLLHAPASTADRCSVGMSFQPKDFIIKPWSVINTPMCCFWPEIWSQQWEK